MIKCIVCNSEYEAKRASSKYCSNTCRSVANRNKKGVSVAVSVAKDKTVKLESYKDLNGKTFYIKPAEHYIGLLYTAEQLKDFPNMCETKRYGYEANPSSVKTLEQIHYLY